MAGSVNEHSQIFVSYRREDSAGIAGRIYDRLVQEFGKDAIFKDVDSIPLGINFKQHIDSVIQKCDVVLVIVGENWAGIHKETNESRLADPRDLVRIEIEAALRRGIPVIPLLINNVCLPSEESLPPSLLELTYRNGMTVGHDPHFHPDIDRLIKSLKYRFATPSEVRPQTQTAEKVRSYTEEVESTQQHDSQSGFKTNTTKILSLDRGKAASFFVWIIAGFFIGVVIAYVGCVIFNPSNAIGYTAIGLSGLLGTIAAGKWRILRNR